jgi:hypothetical protein
LVLTFWSGPPWRWAKNLVFYGKNEHKNIILCSFCHTIVK